MTNLSVSLAYLSYRDDKSVTSGASGNPPGVHNLVAVLGTLWRGFGSKGVQFGGETSRFGMVFLGEPVADSSKRHPNMADDERAATGGARSRARVPARDSPESECGRRVAEERR